MNVPHSTPEKPLTAIDYCAALSQCKSIEDIREFSEQVPISVLNDERYNRAVAARLADIKSNHEGRTHERTR